MAIGMELIRLADVGPDLPDQTPGGPAVDGHRRLVVLMVILNQTVATEVLRRVTTGVLLEISPLNHRYLRRIQALACQLRLDLYSCRVERDQIRIFSH